LSGAAWPIYRDFEVERTKEDVFIYAPFNVRPSEIKQVHGLGELPPDENLERNYAPLRDVPDLFLRFAGLASKKVASIDAALEVMIEWATTYGVLGIDSQFYWNAPRSDYPRTRRESLASFREAVGEAAKCLELYKAAMLLDDDPAKAILEKYSAGGSKGFEGTLREKREWALIVCGEIIGPRIEVDCYPHLLRTVKNPKTDFWYDKRTIGFAQGWGFCTLLGAMYLQMMLYMTGGGEWKPCKRPGCYGRVTYISPKEVEGRQHRTHSNKEFCSRACVQWWSDNFGNSEKAKRKRALEEAKCR
jgi:hypothetical protein